MHTAEYLRIDGRLCFAERWPGPGQPVFCIHTAGQSGVQYREVAPALADRGYDVVVVDLPGHGRSEPAAGGPVCDLPWYADWCVGVVRTLSLDRSWLLGCSIGGSIALDKAATLGHAVRGVVALDPSGVLGGDVPLPSEPLLEDAASPGMRDRTYLGTNEACGRAVPAERAELIAQMHCREDWHVTTSDIHGALTHDIRDRLDRLVCPVYLLGGADAPDGRLPVNTDGGGLCNNQPDNRGGMVRLIEAVRQLRGAAAAPVQVPNCEIAVVHGSGGRLATRSSAATLVLRRED